MNNYTQPYFGNTMQYGYQPMYPNNVQNMQSQIQQMPPMTKIPQTDMFSRLQGKSVDSIDVVKAMDIPLDGSISYFPIADGTAIVTKQLQQDGTSKTIIYKPVDLEKQQEELPKYITTDELEDAIKKVDIPKEIKEELKGMKRDIDDILDDLKDLSKKVK